MPNTSQVNLPSISNIFILLIINICPPEWWTLAWWSQDGKFSELSLFSHLSVENIHLSLSPSQNYSKTLLRYTEVFGGGGNLHTFTLYKKDSSFHMLSSIHSKILIEHLVNAQNCSRQAGSTLNKMGLHSTWERKQAINSYTLCQEKNKTE